MIRQLILLFVLAGLTLTSCLRPADPDAVPPDTETEPDTEVQTEIPPDTQVPETEAPETPVPETEAPATEAPETIPETAAPETRPPETQAPETMPPVTPPSDGQVHVTSISLDKYEVHIMEGLSDMPWVTMSPDNAPNKGEIWTTDNPAVATVDPYGRIMGIAPGTCTVTVASADLPAVQQKVAVTVYASVAPEEPTYINGILVANKSYSLPEDYNPGVSEEVQKALDTMFAAAAEEGLELFVRSGFRPYERQKVLYNQYVARDGQDEADRYSSRPGHSEHQTGLAFDINSVEQSFADTAEGKWLAEHCAEYGFIIRFPLGKEEQTGYMYEPWHVRYLGVENAKAVQESGLCLEEYLGITSEYAIQ